MPPKIYRIGARVKHVTTGQQGEVREIRPLGTITFFLVEYENGDTVTVPFWDLRPA